MISILLALSLILSVQCNQTLYYSIKQLDADRFIICIFLLFNYSLSMTYAGNNMVLIYYEVNTSEITATAYFELLNLTSGVIV